MNYQQRLVASIIDSKASSLPSIRLYQNNYMENALHALTICFPSVLHFLGQADFRGLMKGYVKQHIKSGFNWASYGEGVVDYLYTQDCLAQIPFIAEVAMMDWRCKQIEQANDVDVNTASFALFGEYSADQLTLIAGSGLCLVDAIFPLDTLLTLARLKEIDTPVYKQLQRRAQEQIKHAINHHKPRSFVMWRRNYQAQVVAIESAVRQAFEAILSGCHAEEVLQLISDEPDVISEWLQQAITTQQICGVRRLNNRL